MVTIEFSESISEILDILDHMHKSYTEKIPKKFKDFLEENKSQTYIPNLDHSLKISEMKLKEKTKDILAVIYMNYWCDSQKKLEYTKLLNENEIKYRSEIEEKYNPNNIFLKNKNEKIIKKDFENKSSIVEYRQSILKKIFNKIKSLFKIN